MMMLEAPAAERPFAGCTERMVPVIRSEFAEMPGLRLTRAQFRRLWNLTTVEGERILEYLIETGFLVEGPDGLLRRRLDARR